jgi:olefin beta-lactone synthetase
MLRRGALVNASLPPALPGLDPGWSRLVTAEDVDGVVRTWHVLDNGADPTAGTMVCVHGNPTWSYLWRRFLAQAPEGWRVIAVDQLGMGWSERTASPRTLAQRIDDLDVVTTAMGVTGPLVTVGHDWGGPISLGFALAHRDRLAGVVLANTGVHQPSDSAVPSLIRIARTPALRWAVCAISPIFVRAAGRLSRPAPRREVRDALAAPYASAARRRAVAEFVADIPLEPEHPSAAALDGVAAGFVELGRAATVPVLLLWGPRDPVFSDRYLRDLRARVPHAQVQRYENASHLVTEDAPQAARHTWQWIASLDDPPAPTSAPGPSRPQIWAALTERAGDPAPAVVELHRNQPARRAHGPASTMTSPRDAVSFDLLERRVRALAGGLAAHGVAAGDRVALLVPPGADLTAVVYACWRIGAVIVVADAGLGPARLARALRGAVPDHVIGIPHGLALAAAFGVPGRRIVTGPVTSTAARLLRATRIGDVARAGGGLPPEPGPDADCAVVFTSGATGPAKGVVYRHGQVQAQIDALRGALGITSQDRLVAAFPPFALYGPALGIASSAPDSPPGQLTAAGLADAAAAVDATAVFASPAALRTIVATAAALADSHRPALHRIRLVVSAGAPIPSELLHALHAVLPSAEAHTPYGMTEALPVTDITLAEIDAAGDGNGVCVGRALPGVTVAVSPLSHDGTADGPLTQAADVPGEVCVSAAHVKDRYDQLWATEHDSSRDAGWHRTGDVGHFDGEGRLWIEGRLHHVITTPAGPCTPVGIEQRVQSLPGVTAAAAVGVGPPGTQQVVVVVVPDGAHRTGSVLAPRALATAVRDAAGATVAAVLHTGGLPVDIRHASKVDRTRVARWADRVLAGQHVGGNP